MSDAKSTTKKKTAAKKDEPKLKTLQMSKEEVLELENIALKMELSKSNQQNIISNVCNRLGENPQKIHSINSQTGVIQFNE